MKMYYNQSFLSLPQNMASYVRVKEAIVVTPSEPTPSRILSLSSLDSQLFLRFPIEYLLLYNHHRPSSSTAAAALHRQTTTSTIKSALARALVPYYPLAGRVRHNQQDPSRLEVVCRAQGALFIEAVSDSVAGDFDKAPKSVTQWRKLLPFLGADVLKGAPPLAVQLTWLADGSAVLGVGFGHCLCDGIGSAEFLNLFGDLATGKVKLGELKQKPVWERHLLNSNPETVEDILASHRNYHPEFNRVADLCSFETRFSEDGLTPTSTIFDGRRLNELRKISESSTLFTSFELLSAHIWRCWGRSLNLPANQVLKLLFSVNIRDRVKPGLPSGYYGNAFVLGCARTTVKDLSDKGLGHIAGLVKKAKERIGDEYVREVVESVSGGVSPDSVGVLILSQWSRLGLDRIDFGMKKPVHVGPICCDRYCLMLPVHDQTDAVKVMLAVPHGAVDSYQYFITTPSS
ncbi:alcohol acyltransferase 9 [Impatiens glandulifera]|uniref:alcohol acyltransferase 9 n=1 Tax=Impatiens glandulifera TaxID=253017 RepID=UPI001FB14719|nr:alcohol acyltransferase 9 [Impatiens glandulifera]